MKPKEQPIYTSPRSRQLQRQILILLTRGWTNGEIAYELEISPTYVNHLINSYAREHGRVGRVGAVIAGIANGLIDVPTKERAA